MTDLLPCPLCAEAKPILTVYGISCRCGLWLPSVDGIDVATHWNTRPEVLTAETFVSLSDACRLARAAAATLVLQAPAPGEEEE